MIENALEDCQKELALVKREFEDFVYLVSHDLNAPIRGIANLVTWIAEDLGADIPAEVKQNIALLQNRSARLEKMLAAILSLSRVSRTDLEISSLNLPLFLQKISNNFTSQQVNINIKAEELAITTYYHKLQTVLEELIRNAIQHAGVEVIQITIQVQLKANTLTFDVIDNGQGLAQELNQKIFSLFFTTKNKEENTHIGVGLTQAKSIANFVGGTLELSPTLTGSGTCFTLVWPIKIDEKG